MPSLEKPPIATTTVKTGQQWDEPNGWAPLQWVAVDGLRRYQQDKLAADIGTRFLTQVKLELKLANLEVVHSRVEAFRPESPFDGIVSRAFSSLEDFANWTRHLGGQETRWLAMKGVHPNEELAALPADFRVEAEHALAVPGCQGQRHLLILRRTA